MTLLHFVLARCRRKKFTFSVSSRDELLVFSYYFYYTGNTAYDAARPESGVSRTRRQRPAQCYGYVGAVLELTTHGYVVLNLTETNHVSPILPFVA